MPEVMGVKARVGATTAEAVRRVLPRDFDLVDPAVRRSDRADLQSAVALDLGRRLDRAPRDVAAEIKAELERTAGGADDASAAEMFASVEVSGPGFLNLTVADRALWSVVAQRLADDRLGVGLPLDGSRVLVDYSGPNIAKELHVGHLRSTAIGDALVRVLTYAGADVIKANHLGDWGTQFGKLIQYLSEHPGAFGGDGAGSELSLAELDALYKAAEAESAADAAFAERARNRVVALQAGDPETRAVWAKLVGLSTDAFQEIYRRLGVLLTPEDAMPESFYNSMLDDVVAELARKGLITESEGALCVFAEEFKNAEGEPLPLLVRKSDGGYGYAATDLAALRYRARELAARRILYVIDARQSLHLRMVFAAAKRAGWLGGTGGTEAIDGGAGGTGGTAGIDGGAAGSGGGGEVEAVHVAFGTMLGAGGTPLRSRSGAVPHLAELLDEAVAQARSALEQRQHLLAPDEFEAVVQAAGIGAVKYADLSNLRIKDYIFDPARMVSLTGRTSVYLQYAHARVNSVLGKLPAELGAGERGRVAVCLDVPVVAQERALILTLDAFGEVVEEVAVTLEPHRLCTYLFDVAKAWSDFWEACPILKAATDEQMRNRAALAHLTGRTLRQGLGLLGIEAPRRI